MAVSAEQTRARNTRNKHLWCLAHPELARKHANGWRLRRLDQARAKCRDYYQRNKERLRAYAKKWRAENPGVPHEINVIKKFGLQRGDYARMMAGQNGVCAICRQENRQVDRRTGKKMRLHVDHDADTGRVRGLLCGPCNVALGQFKHDPVIIRAAGDYIAANTPPPPPTP